MCPTVIELRTLNPILDNFSDREIENFIIFLKENEFEWIGSKKIFYHSKLQFSLRTQGLDLFVRDRQAVKNRISESEIKQRESPSAKILISDTKVRLLGGNFETTR